MHTEKLLRMIELADAVMSMCGGDAWERECTEDARAEYNILKDELDRELGRGKYDPAKLEQERLYIKERDEQLLRELAVDCPVCSQRVRVGGLHDHMKSLHSSETPAPSQFKMDKLIAYITENGLGCRLVPISKKTRKKQWGVNPNEGITKPTELDKMNILYNVVKSAAVGAWSICPSCCGEFVKLTPHQAFCTAHGTKCKDRYWNMVRSKKIILMIG